MKIEVNGTNYDIEIIADKAMVDGKEIGIKLNEDEDEITIERGIFRCDFVEDGEPSLMIINGMTYVVSREFARNSVFKEVKSPMTGKIVGVFVKTGNEVKKGQLLVVLEAMKMENQIKSHASGRVREIKICEGQSVNKGEILMTFE
ncbi:MAG: biotin/lipoyl-containing protein [Nitrososphaeraceae archaeon]